MFTLEDVLSPTIVRQYGVIGSCLLHYLYHLYEKEYDKLAEDDEQGSMLKKARMHWIPFRVYEICEQGGFIPSTVYRFLALFEKNGLIKQTRIGNDRTRYYTITTTYWDFCKSLITEYPTPRKEQIRKQQETEKKKPRKVRKKCKSTKRRVSTHRTP